MAVRALKIILVALVGVMALFYALQNVVNLDAAHQVVAAVLSMQGHEYYPDAFGPPVTHPGLVWVALIVILAGEFAAGLVSLKGAFDLLARIGAPAEDFNAAKAWAVVGLGIGLLVWFGLFSVVGETYFQMWQTELGAQSLSGAFRYLAAIGIILIFVNQPDR